MRAMVGHTVLGALWAVAVVAGPSVAQERVVPAEKIERITSARALFQENCAMCHGYDGVPLVAGAANFSIGERLDKSDAELLAIIAKGKNDMPPWQDILSEDDRAAALSYVRVLPGDLVFDSRCAMCHADAVPLPAEDIPEAADVCPGSSVEADMAAKELADVVAFIRGIAE